MNLLQIIQIILLLLGTVFLIYASRKSLLTFKVHGFYRYFVFEMILILVLLNIPYWIREPFTIIHIISWLFLVVSIYLVSQSVYSLKRKGGSRKGERTSTNYNFENTTILVEEGVYKYIRHPMYSSLLFLSLGAFLKDISILSILITTVSIIFLILTAKTEEKENTEYFGQVYIAYMRKTKMFIPFIF